MMARKVNRRGGKTNTRALTAAGDWWLHAGPSEKSYGTCVRTVSQGQKVLPMSSCHHWWRVPYYVSTSLCYQRKPDRGMWGEAVALAGKAKKIWGSAQRASYIMGPKTSFLGISVSPSIEWANTCASLLGIYAACNETIHVKPTAKRPARRIC